jgi:peptide/nickel transport system ATP-binding protein
MSEAILRVENLSVNFGDVRAVDDVSLTVDPGDVYAVVGESGCGKSTLAYSILALVPPPGRICAGRVLLRDEDLAAMPASALNRLRAADVAMVFQAAMNSFNPVLTIGRQVQHILDAHPEHSLDGRAHFTELLDLVRLPAEQVWNSYESQLSGGMKQRVAIAVALLLQPSILVLDEPTTALDVLNQRLIIEILKDLRRSLDVTIIFVTHDLGLVAELASRVAVMYAGRLVEVGSVDEIFAADRRHPYVEALVGAIPSVFDGDGSARAIPGQVPNLAALPGGCRFAPRCGLARPVCAQVDPPLLADAAGHALACHVVNSGRPVREEVSR